MAATDEGTQLYLTGDTKKNAVNMRNRPSPIYMEPHIMPAPSPLPWNSCEMPWTQNPAATYSRVMEFSAEIPHCSRFNAIKKNVIKRKASIEMDIPVKQHINEEKMAEHLNGLHISSNFTSHYKGDSTMSMDSDQSSTNCYSINMSPQDLEEKIKNAQRITVCEQIRQLSSDPIIPRALMERMERPCTALVLWQPPQRLKDLIVARRKQNEEDQDNNNCSMSIDMNNANSMDLDL